MCERNILCWLHVENGIGLGNNGIGLLLFASLAEHVEFNYYHESRDKKLACGLILGISYTHAQDQENTHVDY